MLTQFFSLSFFGGGGSHEEEEETIAKGDDVIIDLDASLEDLYMGGSLKVFIYIIFTMPVITLFEVDCNRGFLVRKYKYKMIRICHLTLYYYQ